MIIPSTEIWNFKIYFILECSLPVVVSCSRFRMHFQDKTGESQSVIASLYRENAFKYMSIWRQSLSLNLIISEQMKILLFLKESLSPDLMIGEWGWKQITLQWERLKLSVQEYWHWEEL